MLIVAVRCVAVVAVVVGVGCYDPFKKGVAWLFPPPLFDSWWCIIVACKSLCAAWRFPFSACCLLCVGHC